MPAPVACALARQHGAHHAVRVGLVRAHSTLHTLIVPPKQRTRSSLQENPSLRPGVSCARLARCLCGESVHGF